MIRQKVMRASAGDRSGARALVLFTVRLPPKQSRSDHLGKARILLNTIKSG